jgi:hypothetical protein
MREMRKASLKNLQLLSLDDRVVAEGVIVKIIEFFLKIFESFLISKDNKRGAGNAVGLIQVKVDLKDRKFRE